ncbi:hypothetical protein TNCT_481281 [Trichonephila clavata]|uniref:Uncharacterized protein n=1 Tax=Trichonephila clavata TaxID=2740835 RepID=A0A8X6GT38_TRICU|nr:hypothetical protein TNCT_481281 [Trichonephila clavata]
MLSQVAVSHEGVCIRMEPLGYPGNRLQKGDAPLDGYSRTHIGHFYAPTRSSPLIHILMDACTFQRIFPTYSVFPKDINFPYIRMVDEKCYRFFLSEV